LRRCTLLHDPAVLDDDKPIGHDHRLERVVGDEQRRAGEGSEVPPEFGAYLQLGPRIERGERFVEQQQPRVGSQRAG